VRSLAEMRHEGVVMQQWDASCGAAALATVLTFGFDDPVSERAVARGMLRQTDELRVKVRGGFSLLDMKRFAEGRGYAAEGYRDLGLPELLALHGPIVPIDEFGYAHFVVVRGGSGTDVEVADPAFGRRTMPRERFEAAWQGGIGFVLRRARQ